MADAQLRQGIRVLCSGGAEILSPQELASIIHICKSALDSKLDQVLSLEKLFQDMNKYSVGAVARLKAAFRTLGYKRDINLKDIIKIDSRKLLSINGYGDRSLIAVKYALWCQLNPQKIPFPLNWTIVPSFTLFDEWSKFEVTLD